MNLEPHHISRFTAKISYNAMQSAFVSTKCHLWTGAGSSNPKSRPKLNVNGKFINAAHIAIYLARQEIVPKGMFACHRCNNRDCVNADHIYVGTPQQNINDSMAAGTFVRGDDSKRAKITSADVAVIRQRKANGDNYTTIAKDYPISRSQVSNICNRKKWAHVP